MKIDLIYITMLIGLLGSFGFGSALVILTSRRKYKADIRLTNTETKLKEVEMYSKMVEDFRSQLQFQGSVLATQGETIKNQATQITLLQTKEQQYLKIIENHQITERELRKVIEKMKDQIKTLQKQYSEQN